MKAVQIEEELKKLADPSRAKVVAGYFKTGKGEYGEGDVFLGVMMGDIRIVSKKYKNLPYSETVKLIRSPLHEIRMCGVLLLVLRYKEDSEKVFNLYIKERKHINNWDLIDSSADKIVGAYLFDKDLSLLKKLAYSKSLWDRRIAIIATFYFIKNGSAKENFEIAEILINDKQDLIHKAVGWMLREVGKMDEKVLTKFLDQNATKMPRTMLRYSIEKFPEEKRKYYLNK